MNEPLLHLLWHPISLSLYIYINQTFQLIIASKLSTLVRSTKEKASDAHNPNDVQTEAKDRSR
jgi:hypothetical protein